MSANECTQDDNSRSRARSIYSTLSNGDALRIFELAAVGIDAGKTVLEEQHFSKKRYYGRLRELIDVGLLQKEKGVYVHTPLGRSVYENQVTGLQHTLARKDSMKMLAELDGRDNPDRFLLSAAKSLAQEAMDYIETLISYSDLKLTRLMTTRQEFAAHVIALAEAASSRLNIAVNKLDINIVEAGLAAATRGCKVSITADWMQEFSFAYNRNSSKKPDLQTVLKALHANPNVRLMTERTPYSFFVFDDLNVAIEVAHPTDMGSFFLGISFKSSTVARRLVSYYQKIGKKMKIEAISPMLEKDSRNKSRR